MDLYARVGEERLLIEAKSLNSFRDAVNRVRYGIGQLADYSYRYQEETGDAKRVLAFARPPAPEVSWVGVVLDRERIAFVCASDAGILALNETARALPILT